KLDWLTDKPVWIDQWPLSSEKLKALEELVEEQLQQGHIELTDRNWNSPVFVIRKPGKDRWRLLHDLREINKVIRDMGSLQPGMPSPTMLPRNWNLVVIDLKDAFFQIPLHPDDAPRFAFSVPEINRKAPRARYHWKVLPQGMKNSPSICQWYIASLLSPVQALVPDVIILHYMDDILLCAPEDDLLAHALDLTTTALTKAGFELQLDKIQKTAPWKYLGLQLGKHQITPQNLHIRTDIRTLNDAQQLCGSLNWLRPWLGLTNEDLSPLFDLLKGGEDLNAPRTLTREAQAALKKVSKAISTRQANRYDPTLPFSYIILGKLPHLHALIFQDPLLIIEWVFLSHHRPKRMTRPQELVAELIRKGRSRLWELSGCEFGCIHIPIKLKSGHLTKEMLEQLLQDCEPLQFALEGFGGQISIHRPSHKIFNSASQFYLSLESVRSEVPINALTIFTDGSGASHRSVVTWFDPDTRRWESDVEVVEGSPQVAELHAVVRIFERFPVPFSLVTDSAYSAGVVERAEDAVLQEVSNRTIFELLSKLVKLVSSRVEKFFVMHVRSHTDLPGF
ncbi:POK18 protein, partial [Chloropsis hardwickii]|nr:POK18 protein [Chloropsis hardwickii]